MSDNRQGSDVQKNPEKVMKFVLYKYMKSHES